MEIKGRGVGFVRLDVGEKWNDVLLMQLFRQGSLLRSFA